MHILFSLSDQLLKDFEKITLWNLHTFVILNLYWIKRFKLCHSFRSDSATQTGLNCATCFGASCATLDYRCNFYRIIFVLNQTQRLWPQKW
jgi:hypothetical protein